MDTAAGTDSQKAEARQWFEALRDRICAAFEAIEDELSGAPLERVGGGRPDGSSARPGAATARTVPAPTPTATAAAGLCP